MTQVAKQDATRPNSGDGGTTSRSLPRPAERPPNAPRGPLPLPRGLRRAFDAAADCIFIVNSEQRIVYWNRAGERLLNRSTAEAVGGRCHQLVAGRTASGPWCRPVCPVWRSVLTGRTVRDFDLLTLSPDRQPLWVSVAILVLRQDREYLTVHVLHDISARKRLERLVTHLLDAFVRYGVVPARPAAGEGSYNYSALSAVV